jgi:hypothetical protein
MSREASDLSGSAFVHKDMQFRQRRAASILHCSENRRRVLFLPFVGLLTGEPFEAKALGEYRPYYRRYYKSEKEDSSSSDDSNSASDDDASSTSSSDDENENECSSED